MNTFARQLVHAVRALRKTPGFTLSALLILTLGIGANTAIFGIVNAVLLKPLPFPQPGSIVTVFHVPPQKSFPGMSIFAVSAANYLDWKKDNTVFESIAVLGGRIARLTGTGRPTSLLATITDPDFFKVLRVQPALGRAFTRAECRPGRDDAVVLSDSFARAHFGSPPNALGRTLLLNGGNHRVIGVMAPELELKSWFPTSADIYLPLAWTPKDAAVRGNHNYLVVARLRPGVRVAEAQAQMNLISDRLALAYPEEDTGWGAAVSKLSDNLVGDVRPALLTLLGAVGFVLLIACANTANLVLARTITRRKDLAIRAALGASTGQVLGPILLETTLLSVAGGAAGLLLARSGQLLVLKALADKLPRAIDIQVDFRVLIFTFAAAVLTGLAAGLIASWRLAKADVHESLKQGLGKTGAFSGRTRTRNALVAAEVALSLILLVGAGLMIRTLWALKSANPGFVSANVLTMTIPIPSATDANHRSRFYDEFLPGVRRLPGVVSVGAIDSLPLDGGGSQQPIVIEGRPHEAFALQPNVAVRVIAPGYVPTMRIPLLAGRVFEPRDTTTGANAVVLISLSMARQFWPGQDPIGQRLRISFTPDVLRQVVGIVADVKERGLDVLRPTAMLYEPLPENQQGNTSLVVRATRMDATLAPDIARVLRRVSPDSPVRDVRWMDEIVAESLAQHRFSMYLFAALASLAFLLAAVGIYSVLAYSVRSRVQEIGIRIALGAKVADVLRLVVLEGMRPALAGIAAGALGAVLLSGILSRLIFGVSPTDPYTFGAVSALLATVALLASLIPAYRATRVEPLKALRHE